MNTRPVTNKITCGKRKRHNEENNHKTKRKKATVIGPGGGKGIYQSRGAIDGAIHTGSRPPSFFVPSMEVEDIYRFNRDKMTYIPPLVY